MAEQIRTTCPYCGVGCGVNARYEGQQLLAVSGDTDHPANQGRLCVKGSALHETTDMTGRLLHPLYQGQRIGWDAALDRVAERFAKVIQEHGPESVAVYLSGQLLTEDYYVANKWFKGFLGSANVDTNSRLCMSSAVAAHKRAFGADVVPGCYEDLDQSDLVVLVGSNTAWAHPILFQRIRAAREKNPLLKVVVIDPRTTATCDEADLHLALQPGSDAWLYNGLLFWLMEHGAIDHDFVAAHTDDLSAALESVREATLERVSTETGLEVSKLRSFYHWFAQTEKTVTLYSQGVNQSSSGVDKINGIINCHLATGRIGRPGMGPFSLTGQPNAMGGREVGGLANQLAAHMDFTPDDIDRVQRYWQAPNMAQQPGLKAVELFEAVHAGKIKAVWIMGTNPVVSLPAADRVKEALSRCEFVVVSDCMLDTDTARCADLLLPAQTWAEKDGTVTNSERRISRQRGFLPAPDEAKPDWWIISQVAQRMGFKDAFDYAAPRQIFCEHAGLSGFENWGQRAFDISALSELSAEEYDALQPVQWPVNAASPRGEQRLFGAGGFFHADGRGRFVAIEPRQPASQVSTSYPLKLNSGRIRDQWHTMTRTGKVPRLLSHIEEPLLEVHPQDMQRYGLLDGGLAQIGSEYGELLLRVRESQGVQPGDVFMPMHWNSCFAAQARVGALVHPNTDPLSGQPESKFTPVRVEPWQPAYYAYALVADDLPPPPAEYWAKVPASGGTQYLFADERLPKDWLSWCQRWLGVEADGEWLSYADAAQGVYRVALLENGQLRFVCYAGPQPELEGRSWLREQLGETIVQRQTLLAGRPAEPVADQGAIVCSCFQVGQKQIQTAVAAGSNTVEDLGERLQCGTNCGSCIPELKTLISALR